MKRMILDPESAACILRMHKLSNLLRNRHYPLNLFSIKPDSMEYDGGNQYPAAFIPIQIPATSGSQVSGTAR